jgi:hypothetical protein
MVVFVLVFYQHLKNIIDLCISSKTEAGSAGEQPARDNLKTSK